MPKRVRSQGENLPVMIPTLSNPWYQNPGPCVWYSTDYPAGSRLGWGRLGYALHRFPTHFSHMTDVVGNAGGLNPVEHVEVSSTMSNFSPFSRGSGYIGTCLFDGVWFPFPIGVTSFADWPWTPQASASSISDWSVEAFNAFHDQVPVKVSLPNFIYELKDMKGMIPSINRLSLTKTASNNFLAWEFGVKPFISDIKAIVSLADSTAKRLDHLIATAGTATRLSFNRTKSFLPEEMGTIVLSTQTPLMHDGWDVEFRMLSARTDFHVGGRLFQDLKDLKGALSQLKALSASSGFNHPARVVWNAIPYSFVVDWFFHVGKLLDSLSIQPFGGTYDVSDVMYSLKGEATWQANQKFNIWDPNAKTQIGIVSARSYVRRNGFPLSSLFLTDLNLSPTQLALSAAMLNQRRG